MEEEGRRNLSDHPDFAGFLVKADSEGRQGPSAYGRTHAQAANTIAHALKPHGGVLIYRAFVYNHHLEWNDLKADRARAAYDNFAPLDGQFDDNAIVQINPEARAQADDTASLPWWCAMAEARGENIVRSAPRKRWSFNWLVSMDSRIASSLIAPGCGTGNAGSSNQASCCS